MKSTYKLYGTFWDNKSYSVKPITIVTNNSKSQNIIVLSEVLKLEKVTGKAFEKDKQFGLLLDYLPRTKSVVVWEFYLKRVMQVADYFQVSQICCKNQADLEYIEKGILKMTKEKHRSDCWRNQTVLPV